jgi:hypothetical protein
MTPRWLGLAQALLLLGCSERGLPIVMPGELVPNDANAFGLTDAGAARDFALSSDLGGPSPDQGADGGDATTPPFNCSSDRLPANASSGMLVTPELTPDLVGLCDGWVVFSDPQSEQLDFYNPVTGEIGTPIRLKGSPGRLTLDGDRGVLFASLSPASQIAMVNLATRDVQYLDGVNAAMMALGSDRQLLAVTPLTNGKITLVVLDTEQNTVLAQIPLLNGTAGSFMVFDPRRNFVIAATADTSPGDLNLYRFLLDPATWSVTQKDALLFVGEGGTDLVISNDGNHVVFPGGGNLGAGHFLDDFHTDNFQMTYGVWQIGAYPVAAAFSSDGRYLAATSLGTSSSGHGNSQLLELRDTSTYTEIKHVDGCYYQGREAPHVAFSRGGKLAFLLAPDCIQVNGANSGTLAYMVLP